MSAASERQKRYDVEHRDAINARKRARYAADSLHRQQSRAYQAKYRLENPDKIKARYARNRATILDNAKKWFSIEGNKEIVRARNRRLKYKLSPERHAQMLEAQDGRCRICPRPVDIKSPVDHDHGCCPGSNSCGRCVRGILCTGCNTRMVALDDRAWLKSALDYLVATRASRASLDAMRRALTLTSTA